MRYEGTYYSLKEHLEKKFGEKVKKIPLDAGLTCPNRDGRKGKGGCIYCDSRGSGTGLASKLSLKEQLEFFRERLKQRGYKKFIAYFQSFSNTYAPIEKLKELYDTILNFSDVVGLAIGTRPDCVSPEIINLLKSYQERGYYLWVELGLQSKHDKTLRLINRGHTFKDFLNAFFLLKESNIPVCIHLIFGLPGETKEMMLDTVKTVAELQPEGIKFHALYVLENTPLANLYQEEKIKALTLEEYANLVATSLSLLSPSTIIHRLTSDPPRQGLLGPLWLLYKNRVMREIEKNMKERKLYQGKFFKKDPIL
ncbi:MAG: TIGR01212 family radical SAM protein [Caldimicrobium sp.]|nr:TIGR01212 family radical SAM protein [Caldimicrobium sp.]MCX7872853.1 TIGR01212 family radical SAM protein [Caldimicrobium sp.]MDW8093568.1 TIGR01212 family radical SAM protein [Caldimicrobium sp.]